VKNNVLNQVHDHIKSTIKIILTFSFIGVEVHEWAVVCFADRCRDQDIFKFARQMENVCRQEGMTMSSRLCSIEYGRSPQDVSLNVDY